MLIYTFNEEANTREFVYDENLIMDPEDIKKAEEIVNFFYSEFDWPELYISDAAED